MLNNASKVLEIQVFNEMNVESVFFFFLSNSFSTFLESFLLIIARTVYWITSKEPCYFVCRKMKFQWAVGQICYLFCLCKICCLERYLCCSPSKKEKNGLVYFWKRMWKRVPSCRRVIFLS